jgi:hypothetical protein
MIFVFSPDSLLGVVNEIRNILGAINKGGWDKNV